MVTSAVTDEEVASRLHEVRQWVWDIIMSPHYQYHLARSSLTSAHAGNDTPRMQNLHAWLYMIVSATLASDNANLRDNAKRAIIQAEMAWPWTGWLRHHHVPSYSPVHASMHLTWYTTTLDPGLPENAYVLKPVLDASITMLPSFSRPDTFDDFIGHHHILTHPPAEEEEEL